MTPDLAAAVDAALDQHPADGTWEALCVAAVRLGAAVAGFDRARSDYIVARKVAPEGARNRRDEG